MATATIRDVARLAGVGVGTVSRVLNESSAVSPDTRRKVEDAIEALDYVPHPAARSLSLGKTLTIGVIVPFFTNPSVVERLRGIEAVLARSEYDLTLFNVETTVRRDACLHQIPRRERVDGVLIISLQVSEAETRRFAGAEIPVVLIDSYHPQVSHVVVDNFGGAYAATRYLIGLGHRRVGYITDYLENPFNSAPLRDRYHGYFRALEEAELQLDTSYVRQGEHGRREARRLAHDLLETEVRPTAILAYSDTQAAGVLQAASDLGLDVPGDLSVVGYDDIEVAEYMGLSTVRQRLAETGRHGAELLLAALETDESEPVQVILPAELVIRQTSGPPHT